MFQMFSGIERKLCLRVWYKVFLSKIFGLTMPKKSLERCLCFRKVLLWKEPIDKNGGGTTFLLREVFVLQCRKMS